MKKTFITLFILIFSLQAFAVLKEKDLARTLGVLKAELKSDYDRQQAFMSIYEQQGTTQHNQLVSYMHQCEQIGLMLYSQSQENTFDMAYACQQASDLYRDLHHRNSKMTQYDKIMSRLKVDIERYDALISSLKSMPPVTAEDADSVLSMSDSILIQAIDSLASKKDSLLEARDSMQEKQLIMAMQHAQEEEEATEPLFLTGQQLRDREECLQYAITLRENLCRFLEALETESRYYQSVREKVELLNTFAQERYRMLQDNIFKNGGSNYFSILANLPMNIMMAKHAVQAKYKPFEGHESTYSEWRGATVLFISIFLVFYLAISLIVSYVILRWMLPSRWRGKDFKMKRRMLNNVVGIAIFAIIVMIVRTYAHRNFIQMGTGLIINMAWLLEAIFLSLYIRLRGEQMKHAAAIYTPLMLMAFIVILFRIVLIPNPLVNLVYPPLLLVFAIWQAYTASRHKSTLPMLDVAYTNITTLAMTVACITSWAGYTLLAVQIMVWWTFQLAAIMTITCIYDLMEMYEQRLLVFHLCPELKIMHRKGEDIKADTKQLLSRMKAGEFFGKTWGYDLVSRTVVPITAVLSVLISIYWSAEIFEMTDICKRAFVYNFINVPDLIQVSLFKLCLVAALWFAFSYINYSVRSTYAFYHRQLTENGTGSNTTLARNIIAILCWGLYFIIALVILKVPKSGISIVGAGLATGLGFAMQSILENFFYGISLMTGRLRVGDYIECDGIAGKVESITYQSTQIITADGCVISFLNSALFSKNFKNMTRNHQYELVKIPIGVAYGTNVQSVRTMLINAITPICRERNSAGMFVTDQQSTVSVSFADFGDSSVDLKVCVWMLVSEKVPLTGRIKEVIYNTLNDEGIEIPFPQRDVHIKG